MKTLKLTALLLALSFSQLGQAAVGESVGQLSNRSAKKIGITTGFGNPFPSILGINMNYNALDFLRATAGYGQMKVSSGGFGGESEASVTTVGAGVEAFVPGWSLSPMAGLHVSSVDVKATPGASISIQGVDKSTTLTYVNAGLDWQSSGGFNLGVGQIASLSGGTGSGSYFNIGWFF